MRFQINVSQYDIDTGTRRFPSDCMIHRAFMRATDGSFERTEVLVEKDKNVGWYIQVGRREIGLWKQLLLRKLPGGDRLDHIIESWDAGGTIEPFSFWIELPTEMFQRSLLPVERPVEQGQLNLSKGE